MNATSIPDWTTLQTEIIRGYEVNDRLLIYGLREYWSGHAVTITITSQQMLVHNWQGSTKISICDVKVRSEVHKQSNYEKN